LNAFVQIVITIKQRFAVEQTDLIGLRDLSSSVCYIHANWSNFCTW